MGVSNITLLKIGAIGGILTVSMGVALRYKINNNIKQTPYYKEALTTLRANKGAVYLLGEPIKDGRIDVGNTTENFTQPPNAQYQVPVKGVKKKGTLYFWATKTEDTWTVDRIELGLADEPNRRLLIKKSTMD